MLIINSDGRACTVRAGRREKGGREKEEDERERGHERVAKRYEENQRGIRRDRERGGGEETSLGAEECRGTKRESFSVVDESRSRVFLLMIDDRCIDSSPSAL